jgi:phenolic acid decarboxylase
MATRNSRVRSGGRRIEFTDGQVHGADWGLHAETLIVWTEPLGTDMALSFQEPEGCAAIW